MGGSTSRNQVSATRRPGPTLSYRYPPEDGGNYFSTHYYLGHRKFESSEPEMFLFGELSDLNYLPPRPTTFPYKQPPKNQPIACLRSLINVQRESLKLIRMENESPDYKLEFTFDCDVDCSFTIIRDIPDSITLSTLAKELSSCDEEMTISPTFHYSSGSDQLFNQSSFQLTPSQIDESKLSYDPENEQNRFPLVILMKTNSATANVQQAQLTICYIERTSNSNGYSIKVLKQKLLVDGVEYLLQEIYGVENKARENGDTEDDDSDTEEDLGAECVICITDTRDTILLPCRHLCLCNSCAANLRYQSSNCPICRAPFRALLQIQALEPLDSDLTLDDDEITGNPKYSVPGYQCVPLLQALNGYNLEEDTGPQPEQVSNEEPPQPRSEDVCVVPIEDETLETDNVSPNPAQMPTTTLPNQPPNTGKSKLAEQDTLPGTPDLLNTTTDMTQEQVAISLNPTDESQCASSVSSEASIKSSDMLLPTVK